MAAEIDQNTKAVATAGAQLDALRIQLASNRHVLSQPDWSLLLALLSKQAGDQIVLASCTLNGNDAAPGTATPQPQSRGLILHLSGNGKTNQSITDFVLRLENTHLFSKVTLVDTANVSFLGGDAYSFRIDCPLDATK